MPAVEPVELEAACCDALCPACAALRNVRPLGVDALRDAARPSVVFLLVVDRARCRRHRVEDGAAEAVEGDRALDAAGREVVRDGLYLRLARGARPGKKEA